MILQLHIAALRFHNPGTHPATVAIGGRGGRPRKNSGELPLLGILPLSLLFLQNFDKHSVTGVAQPVIHCSLQSAASEMRSLRPTTVAQHYLPTAINFVVTAPEFAATFRDITEAMSLQQIIESIGFLLP